jgi:hypothetical protein
MLAFSAVQTSGQTGVTFEFRQPWWYDICVFLSLIGWALAIGGLCVFFPKSRGSGA